jgi:hypothetical protein
MFLPGDRHVVLGSRTGHVQLFDVAGGTLLEEVQTVDDEQAEGKAVCSICLTPNKVLARTRNNARVSKAAIIDVEMVVSIGRIPSDVASSFLLVFFFPFLDLDRTVKIFSRSCRGFYLLVSMPRS